MRTIYFFLIISVITACQNHSNKENVVTTETPTSQTKVSLVILGTIQDAGSPHIACTKKCCADLFLNPDPERQVISLGVVDHVNNKRYLFEATPDISRQMKSLRNYNFPAAQEIVNGIFLTHAHIGHYAGLMYLGKEAIDANRVPVYTMPRMKEYLETNGPWSQLVERENIDIIPMQDEKTIPLTDRIEVTPFLVPHRDEFSETVGYHIKGPNKSALFIPDIDKWEKWSKDILEEIKKVDYAFLDATFYSGEEINRRDISEIPHPFIIESIEKFSVLEDAERQKVTFIHFNHTNPVLNPNGEVVKSILNQGFKIAQINESFEL